MLNMSYYIISTQYSYIYIYTISILFWKIMLWVLGCCFWEIYLFSRTCFFFLFSAEPYTRMCVSTVGSYSTFGNIVKKYGKTQVESWVSGFSLIFDFSVYLKNSSRITFPPSGGGPCSEPSSFWQQKSYA